MSIDLPLSRLLDEIQSTMLDRHRKYGPTNVSGAPGGPLNGIRTRLWDKLARINHAVDNDNEADFDDDSFRDAFVDCVGFGLIGLLVLDGDWPGVTPEKPLANLIDEPLRDILQRNLDRQMDEIIGSHTYRWSELVRLDNSREPDSWKVGTKFRPSDPWAFIVWTRKADGWSVGEADADRLPNLRSVVEQQGYTDGVITEPAWTTPSQTEEKAAA